MLITFRIIARWISVQTTRHITPQDSCEVRQAYEWQVLHKSTWHALFTRLNDPDVAAAWALVVADSDALTRARRGQYIDVRSAPAKIPARARA